MEIGRFKKKKSSYMNGKLMSALSHRWETYIYVALLISSRFTFTWTTAFKIPQLLHLDCLPFFCIPPPVLYYLRLWYIFECLFHLCGTLGPYLSLLYIFRSAKTKFLVHITHGLENVLRTLPSLPTSLHYICIDWLNIKVISKWVCVNKSEL